MADQTSLWVYHLRMQHDWSIRRIARHLQISEALVRELLDYYEQGEHG